MHFKWGTTTLRVKFETTTTLADEEPFGFALWPGDMERARGEGDRPRLDISEATRRSFLRNEAQTCCLNLSDFLSR